MGHAADLIQRHGGRGAATSGRAHCFALVAAAISLAAGGAAIIASPLTHASASAPAAIADASLTASRAPAPPAPAPRAPLPAVHAEEPPASPSAATSPVTTNSPIPEVATAAPVVHPIPTSPTAPPTPAVAPTTTEPAPAAEPATGSAQGGCAAAVAYLSTHAAPGFQFECPGDALGHQAMTCVDVSGVCPGTKLIVIADACPAAYMNEAHNSWVLTGRSTGPIDPYGYCH